MSTDRKKNKQTIVPSTQHTCWSERDYKFHYLSASAASSFCLELSTGMLKKTQ